ncbi:hypothetical protein ZIOFF_008373 [Zingiber officinale]|uniref:Uncharacterized protein n=1 Tax=Zingiber officinale TaxID=94328 RepID=A0A8J5I694_ZINOF|nr:hypothetical protein ZIOFF_008373 [Zingiber officinale]
MLLKKGTEDVQYNSAMALMGIASMAGHNADLRRSTFKLNSLASKAIIEQFLQIVDKGELTDLLIARVTTLGCLRGHRGPDLRGRAVRRSYADRRLWFPLLGRRKAGVSSTFPPNLQWWISNLGNA